MHGVQRRRRAGRRGVECPCPCVLCVCVSVRARLCPCLFVHMPPPTLSSFLFAFRLSSLPSFLLFKRVDCPWLACSYRPILTAFKDFAVDSEGAATTDMEDLSRVYHTDCCKLPCGKVLSHPFPCSVPFCARACVSVCVCVPVCAMFCPVSLILFPC